MSWCHGPHPINEDDSVSMLFFPLRVLYFLTRAPVAALSAVAFTSLLFILTITALLAFWGKIWPVLR